MRESDRRPSTSDGRESPKPSKEKLADVKLRSSGSLSQLLPLKASTTDFVHQANGKEAVPEPVRLARGFVEGVNDSNWEHPSFTRHIAPDFKATNDTWQTPTPFPQYLSTYRAFKASHPNFRMEILSESFDINERQNRSTVWHFARVTGHPEGVQRDSLGMSQWRKDASGIWVCYGHAGWRTSPGFATA